MSLTRLPVIADDPYGPEAMRDPHPLYARMREAGPLVYLEKYGAVASCRYDVVREALLDWRSFTSARGVGLADLKDAKRWPGLKPSGLVEQDPPNHTVARAAIGRLFTPKMMRPLRAGIAAKADALVDSLLERASFDAYEDLAHAFVLSIVPDLIGVPELGRENMLPFSTLSIQASTSPHNDEVRRILGAAGPLREWIETSSRRENLAPGGMGAMIWEMADAGEIDDELAVKLIRALMTAGMDTTIYAIVNTVHSLLSFPEQWEALRENPSLARFVLDETLRYESVTQTITRTVSADLGFCGAELPEGTKIILFNAATGRDPRRWGGRADRYDLSEPSAGHLGLGFGIHQCVGQALAKMESEALFTALASKVQRLQPGDGERRILGIAPLRSWTRLPVAIAA